MERGPVCASFIVIDIGDVVAVKRMFHVSDGCVICDFDE
jgi:hypothetical protein